MEGQISSVEVCWKKNTNQQKIMMFWPPNTDVSSIPLPRLCLQCLGCLVFIYSCVVLGPEQSSMGIMVSSCRMLWHKLPSGLAQQYLAEQRWGRPVPQEDLLYSEWYLSCASTRAELNTGFHRPKLVLLSGICCYSGGNGQCVGRLSWHGRNK